MEMVYEVDPFEHESQFPQQKRTRRKMANKTCYKCNKVFPYAYNCRRHMKTCKYPNVKGAFKCSECLEVFYCSDMYFAHLPEKHADIIIEKHKFEFQTHEEFHQWKLNMEKDTSSFYKKDYHYKRTLTNVKVVERYHCHRSGIYVSRGTGKRNSKGKNSNKCGYYCPAMFTRSVEGTGRSFVLFQSTHLGHTCEENQSPPSQAVRNKNRPKKVITAENLASVSYQDLENIVASYGLTSNPADLPNLKSVGIWVRQMMNCGSNPILLFKDYNDEDDSFPFLNNYDFVLGFMNDIQEEVISMYGNNVILIDTTGGDGKHCIQLTSILVKGQNGEGLPVAFLWSNNLSEKILEVFFRAILDRGCLIDCKTFMSDHNNAYYNAWYNVFGPTKFNLFCESDVKETWAENASIGPNSIKNLEKRKEVLNVLNSMQKETDLKTFKCSLDINSTFWLEDPVTEKFGTYFLSNFAKVSHMWAACYRDNSTSGMDDVLEKWHEHLYNIDLKVGSEDKIDQTIYYIMKSKREVLVNQVMLFTEANHRVKLNEIKKFHKLAVGMFENNNSLHQLSENVWVVPSFAQKGVVYKVRHLNTDQHDCDLNCYDCGSCVHQYSCSCIDSTIKFEICKHTHLICLYLQATCSQLPCISGIYHSKSDGDLFSNQAEPMSETCILDLRLKAQNAFLELWPCISSLNSKPALQEVINTMDTLQNELKHLENN